MGIDNRVLFSGSGNNESSSSGGSGPSPPASVASSNASDTPSERRERERLMIDLREKVAQGYYEPGNRALLENVEDNMSALTGSTASSREEVKYNVKYSMITNIYYK